MGYVWLSGTGNKTSAHGSSHGHIQKNWKLKKYFMHLIKKCINKNGDGMSYPLTKALRNMEIKRDE